MSKSKSNRIDIVCDQPLKLGKIATTLQFLSRIYAIPIVVDFKKKIFKFSYFNLQFLFYAIFYSIPFGVYVGWLLYQPHYCDQLAKAFFKVYAISDLFIMAFCPGFFFLPIGKGPLN